MDGLVTNLVRDERIQTTSTKAKELRRYAERTISWGASVAELVERDPDKLEEHEKARIIHAMRMARRTVRDRNVLHKLFHEIAPRYLGRPGGYTRIIKIGYRHGDAAPLSYVELIPGEATEATEAETPETEGEGEDTGQTKKASKAKGKAKAEPKSEAKAAPKGGKKSAKAAAPAKAEKKPAGKKSKKAKDEE
jgi:large subunit ribosomal protein L17